MYIRTGGDIMLTAKVFKCGNSQAIRIPSEMKTTQTEFYIQKSGECLFLIPKDDPWAMLRETLGTFPPDFMEDREQPTWADQPEREEL